jgi:cytochrome c oxidase subunit 2
MNLVMQNNSWIPLFPDQASTFAWEVDALYFYIIAVCLFFGVGVVIAVCWFALKYREREKFASPPEIHGSNVLEITWTAIPFVIAMTIFVFGTYVFFNLYRMPADAMEVYVVGKQWMWKIQHPTGQREINELHVPVGVKVKLVMTTEDVLHDVYIPAFRTKADVVPGRYTYLWFEATKPGKYHLYCAEYCGLNHSGMGGWVYVMEQRDYDNWLAGNVTNQTPVEAGQDLFQNKLGCASCHQDMNQGRGPSLKGIFGKDQKLTNGQSVKVDENYIRDSILNPQGQIAEGYQPIMPTFKGQVSEDQLNQLVAYIKSLSGNATGASSGSSGSSNTATSGTSSNTATSSNSATTSNSNVRSNTAPANTAAPGPAANTSRQSNQNPVKPQGN